MSARIWTLCIVAGLACKDPTGSVSGDANGQVQSAARMGSLLQSLVLFEESYYADSVNYTDDLSFPQMWFGGASGFKVPAGLDLTIEDVSQEGWLGTVVDPAHRVRCAIYIGPGPQEIKGAAEGEPQCTVW